MPWVETEKARLQKYIEEYREEMAEEATRLNPERMAQLTEWIAITERDLIKLQPVVSEEKTYRYIARYDAHALRWYGALLVDSNGAELQVWRGEPKESYEAAKEAARQYAMSHYKNIAEY